MTPFLSRYPPFDALQADELARLAKAVEIEHFPADTVILQQSGQPRETLYVVRKGAVELIAEGRLLISSSRARCSGSSPARPRQPHADGSRPGGHALLPDRPRDRRSPPGSSAGLSFVMGTMRTAGLRAEAGAADPRLPPVGSLVRRGPVTADPAMPVAAAAERMAAQHVSSLLVPTHQGGAS